MNACDPGDVAPFSCSVPALVHDDQRDLPLEEEVVQFEHLDLELGKRLLEFVFGEDFLRVGVALNQILFWLYDLLCFLLFCFSFINGLALLRQGFYDGCIYFQDRILAVSGLDDCPGCPGCVRLLDEIVKDRECVVIMVVEVPDRWRYQACRERVSLPLFKPLFCSSLVICRKNFRMTVPSSASCRSKVLIWLYTAF